MENAQPTDYGSAGVLALQVHGHQRQSVFDGFR